MYSHRQPIRDVRNEHLDNTDRLAEFHEQRIDPEHSVRSEQNYPLAVFHIAPKLAFSKAATRFPLPELLNRDVRLHSGSNRPSHPELMSNRVATTVDPAPERGKGGREISLYENGVVEVVTGRVSYEKGNDHFISDASLVGPIVGNLATVLSLLAERNQDQKVLATATYIGCDGARFKPNSPTSTVTDDYIQAPVVSFAGYDSEEATEIGTYDIRTEYLKELYRPLYHSAGIKDLPMEIPESIELPDLSTEE